jgi:hypothetical protein
MLTCPIATSDTPFDDQSPNTDGGLTCGNTSHVRGRELLHQM